MGDDRLDDYSPLLHRISEEVLLRLIEVGCFTKTDIGHLRATCKALRDFLNGRFRRVVDKYVVGDLSKYRPYQHWDIYSAARNGHLELVELLHEDEVKRGRVSYCRNERDSARYDDDYVPMEGPYGNWDVYVFIMCNRIHDVTPTAPTEDVPVALGDPSRAHALALLEMAPECVEHYAAINGAIRRGEMDLILRLLPPLEECYLQACFRSAFDIPVAYGCGDFAAVIEAIYEYRRNSAAEDPDDALLHAAEDADDAHFGVLLDLVTACTQASVGRDHQDDTAVASCATFSAGLPARLQTLGSKRAEAKRAAEDAARGRGKLVQLLLHGEHEAAKEVAACMGRDDLLSVVDVLWDLRAVAALEWMRSKGHLGADKVVSMCWSREVPRLSSEFVDFAWDFAQHLPQCKADDIAMKWLCCAISAGDAALLRHLCAHLDVVGILSRVDMKYRIKQAIDKAAQDGHSAVVSYMIDVSADNAHQGLFDLTSALDRAVWGGHVGLVHMIDRRVPGLHASLSLACQSRRWELFHFVRERVEHLPDFRRLEEYFRAVDSALCAGRLEFVQWIKQNEPDIFECWLEDYGGFERLVGIVPELIACDILETFPESRAGSWINATTYHIIELEARLGAEFVIRPLDMKRLCEDSARGALQAAIDFRIPIKRATDEFVDRLVRKNPAFGRWLKERLQSGAFVFA